MKLDTIRPCTNYMTMEQAIDFFFGYFERRKEEFERVVVKPKRITSTCTKEKKTRKKDEKISLSPEEFALLRRLGLC